MSISANSWYPSHANILGVLALSASTLLVSALRSKALGYLDEIGGHLGRLREGNFRLGLGSLRDLLRAVDATTRENADNSLPPDVVIDDWVEEGNIRYANCRFTSPIAHHIVIKETKVCQAHIQIVIPASLTFEQVIKQGIPIAIHQPATGDEFFGMRRRYLAAHLATHNVASILLMHPYYGHRRASSQASSSLEYVYQMSEQCLAAVLDCNAVVNWLTRICQYRGKLIFTGISFGGSMAALASLYCSVEHAVVAYVPANGPKDAYVHGVLKYTVPFHLYADMKSENARFQEILEHLSSNNGSRTNGQDMVDALLSPMDIAKAVREICETHRQSPHSPHIPRRVYIQLNARHDRYVPISRALHLYEHMSMLPGVVHKEFIDMEGGHVTAILFGSRGIYIDNIMRAIKLLDGC
eukprot:gene38205-46423_t